MRERSSLNSYDKTLSELFLYIQGLELRVAFKPTTDSDAINRLKHFHELVKSKTFDDYTTCLEKAVQFKKLGTSNRYFKFLQALRSEEAYHALSNQYRNVQLGKLMSLCDPSESTRLKQNPKALLTLLSQAPVSIINQVYEGANLNFTGHTLLTYLLATNQLDTLVIVLTEVNQLPNIPTLPNLQFGTYLKGKDASKTLLDLCISAQLNRLCVHMVGEDELLTYIPTMIEYENFALLAEVYRQTKMRPEELIKKVVDMGCKDGILLARRNYNLLHFACQYGLVDLADYVLKHKIMNAETLSEDRSAYAFAVEAKSGETLKILKKYKVKLTAIDIALINESNVPSIKLFLQELKRYKRNIKHDVCSEANRIARLPDKHKPTAVDAILSETYIDKEIFNDPFLRGSAILEIKKIFTDRYERFPRLQPFFNLWALASLGVHQSPRQEVKKLRNVITQKAAELILEDLEFAGVYTGKFTTFTKYVSGYPDYANLLTASVITHEAGHYLFRHLFSTLGRKFLSELREIRQYIEEHFKPDVPIIGEILYPPETVYKHANNRDDEVFVRLWELLIVHPDSFEKLLKEHPKINAFIKDVAKHCELFCQQLNVESHVALNNPRSMLTNRRNS